VLDPRPNRLGFRLAIAWLIVVLVVACAGAGGTTPSPTLPAAAAPVATPRTADEDVQGGAIASAIPAAGGPRAPEARPPAVATPVPPPAIEPYAINLYRRGDYVAQYTFEWCVGASIQMTLAMTGQSEDMSRRRQQALWEMARDRSSSPFGGANPRGWVAALNELGAGPYQLVSEPDLEAAVRRAALALAETRRPVGLVMWRGRHAWVMSGFESIGDPRVHAGFTVSGVRVLDPLHPHGSRVWGRSPAPNSLLTLDQLGRQFVARTSSRVNLGVPPGYLLVLPVADA
jgi:hypothetical protein